MSTRRLFMTALASLALLSAAGLAPAFSRDAILTMAGPSEGGPVTRALALADLDAMPQTSFATTTPWSEGVVKFSGVRLRDALAATGISGKTIQLVALNDYAATGELAELVAADALLATRQDGEIMRIDNKGPVFLVFPFDSRSDLQHQRYYSRAVWQLAEIDVE